MFLLSFSELKDRWCLASCLEGGAPTLWRQSRHQSWACKQFRTIPRPGKMSVAHANSSVAFLKVHKDRHTLHRGPGQQHRVPSLLPLGSIQLSFWPLTFDPLFFVLFLVPVLCIGSLTSVSPTCPSGLSNDFSKDSHLYSSLSLSIHKASSILVRSPVPEPKCWHECTQGNASPLLSLLDVRTNRDQKFQ